MDTEKDKILEENPSHPLGDGGKRMIEGMNEEHREMTDWAFDFLKNEHPASILDVGCGGGAAIANLHARYPQAIIYGIDISDVSVLTSIAYNEQAVLDGTVRIVPGSVDTMPYPADFFNLVVSISSYFFWPDFTKALSEILRALKPGGTVLLISAIHKGRDAIRDREFENLEYVHNFFTVDAFKKRLEEAGFVDVDIHTREDEDWICAEAKKR